MTARKERACSGPPKSRTRPYDNRPGTGLKRAPDRKPGGDQIRVLLPSEPPRLTPGAARALLRILVKAYARLEDHDERTGGSK
jgi:hypothetical protein